MYKLIINVRLIMEMVVNIHTANKNIRNTINIMVSMPGATAIQIISCRNIAEFCYVYILIITFRMLSPNHNRRPRGVWGLRVIQYVRFIVSIAWHQCGFKIMLYISDPF